jgi:aerobic carbon-monoxide dehydrogenase large subunit
MASPASDIRREDDRLLRGQGRYTDDVPFEGEAHGVVFRSPYAHGNIQNLDVETARMQPGILAVYTYADLAAAGYTSFPFDMPIKNQDGFAPFVPDRFALAMDRVRHVGEAVAFVVAETRSQARDAADLIEFEVEALPVVVKAAQALAEGAPSLHEGKSNLCLDWQGGDVNKVEAAFTTAAHIAKVDLDVSRLAVATMEPRCGAAFVETTTGRLTLHMATQGVWDMHHMLAGVMNLPPENLRVISENVGGGFGLKAQYHGEPVLLLHAARDLGRPVRWRDDRSESFLSDFQARDWQGKAELALDEVGNFLAVRIDGLSDMGAYVGTWAPSLHSFALLTSATSLYQTPAISVRTRCVLTNKLPITPYRGAGQPEGNLVMERLVRAAARLLSRDPVELRRQNMIKADQIPWKSASGATYDSGNFEAVLDKALAQADYEGFAARKSTSEVQGKIRGQGLICYLKSTGSPSMETGKIRFTDDGRITLVTGTLDQGQGHTTTYGKIVADAFDVPEDLFDLVQGDSDQIPGSFGTTGSKSTINSGTAFSLAADEVIEKGKQWAGHVLEAAVQDIEFAQGRFSVTGTDRDIELMDLVALGRNRTNWPAGLPNSLDANLLIDTPSATYPNGCHICEVEIDPATGAIRLDRYTAVDDFGTRLNHMIVEGQVHGGIVQGASQILLENIHYDQSGQLLTGSFMDYAMPRADNMPSFVVADCPSPATTNPLGVKGCGEAGTTGALPCVMDAILNALEPYGIHDLDMPVTAEKIWHLVANPKSTN